MTTACDHRQLPRVYPLPPRPGVHSGLPDLENFCRAILVNTLKQSGRQPDQWFEDDLAYLLGESVVAERQYDPARNPSFVSYMSWKLTCQLRQQWRSRIGRRGGKLALVNTYSLEWELEDYYEGTRQSVSPVDYADSGMDRLAKPAGWGEGDRVDARRWLQSTADSPTIRVDREPSRCPSAATENGDPRPTFRTSGRAKRRDSGAARGGAFRDCQECGWRNYRQAPNGQPGWHFEQCLACGLTLES